MELKKATQRYRLDIYMFVWTDNKGPTLGLISKGTGVGVTVCKNGRIVKENQLRYKDRKRPSEKPTTELEIAKSVLRQVPEGRHAIVHLMNGDVASKMRIVGDSRCSWHHVQKPYPNGMFRACQLAAGAIGISISQETKGRVVKHVGAKRKLLSGNDTTILGDR
jgi:hypothetical protein